jgi:hypothetical protein
MALETLRTLSEADVSLLQGALDRMRRLPGGGPTTGGGDDYFTPETYIILTPGSGIPARVGIIPGVAECQIYRLAERPGGLMYLDLVFGLTKPIYNLSLEVLPGNDYLPATRDKFGSWLATCCGGTGTTGSGSGGGGGPDGGGGDGTVSVVCCPGILLPAVTHLTTTSTQCPCLVGTFALTWDGSKWTSAASSACPGHTFTWSLGCVPSAPVAHWYLDLLCDGTLIYHAERPIDQSSCAPLSIPFTGTVSGPDTCCAGLNRVINGTVTE